ncbi:MAG: WD40 repeat domain-containing protein, partial [Candidatus Poseidoniaceae archaeon]
MAALMVGMLALPMASAADSDGDGIDDSSDDCPYSYGDSSVDRSGCPDRDGDGTSDVNDGWTSVNPSFAKDVALTSNFDYWDIDHSPDGEFMVSSDENGYARIRNSTTGVIIRSVQAFTDDATQVAWSGDGTYIAVSTDAQDVVKMYWASNLSNVHGDISADVGGGDQVNDLAFSNDGSMLAIAIGRSGNGGTNGVVRVINTTDGTVINNANPAGEDRFYSVAFAPSDTHLVAGGNGEAYIVETSTWTTTYTIGTPAGSVNDVAWSPDGERISVCEGYTQGQGGSRLRLFNT